MPTLEITIAGRSYRLTRTDQSRRHLRVEGDRLLLAEDSGDRTTLGCFAAEMYGWYFRTEDLDRVHRLRIDQRPVTARSTAVRSGMTVTLSGVTVPPADARPPTSTIPPPRSKPVLTPDRPGLLVRMFGAAPWNRDHRLAAIGAVVGVVGTVFGVIAAIVAIADFFLKK